MDDVNLTANWHKALVHEETPFCKSLPVPHLSPGKDRVEEVGQGVEETQPYLLTRHWFGEGLLLPG